ncbi:MAG: DUF87 domain-containing protein [Ktedonobacteraceae bacterium]|nr:DUF87 domain-containing protein [Ktedonobacteraceae bacterium]
MSEETRNDKLLLAGASLPLIEGAIAALHGGPIGAIVGLGLSGIVYLVADEMAQRGKAVVLPRPSFQQGSNNKQSFFYRAFNGKDFREEEEPEEYEEELLLEGLTFRELLELGVIQKAISQGKMLLGYADGVARFGSWEDYYSCGVGGVSGSGKTTTVRCLLFQTVLARGKLIMIDPHIEEQQESLAAQFKVFTTSHVFPPCGDNQSAVIKRIRWLMKEYTKRKEHGIKGPHIILVLDELNALIRRLPPELRKELADLLLTIAQEGRKFGLFALLIAQRWSEQDLGGRNFGAAIRTSLASTLAHRFTDEEQAQKLIGRKNAARCLELEQGHYLFRDTQGQLMEMTTPLTVESDATYIQRLLGVENSPEKTEKPRENTPEREVSDPPETPRNQAETTERTPENPQMLERARQIIAMQAEGAQKPDIMRQLWKVNPGGSEDYKRANEEYQHVMRFIAERL